uniref:Uncharacterized protein n=1 Tax=Sphaeramia orbicularis TaxID=375764 RepID=A0A673CR75_9TELE
MVPVPVRYFYSSLGMKKTMRWNFFLINLFFMELQKFLKQRNMYLKPSSESDKLCENYEIKTFFLQLICCFLIF